MSNVPGVFTNVTNTLVSAPAPLGDAIFIAGHLTATPADWTKFDVTTTGTIKSFSSYGDWLNALGGALATDNWVEGVADSGSGATTPNDAADSLLRGLALIYRANPAAKVYAAIIDSTITDETAAPAGLTIALTEALKYTDISYVVVPGYNPLTEVNTHCIAAAAVANPYNSPRMYVTGIDLFSAFDPIGDGGTLPLDATDLTEFGDKNANGLCVAYVGNHMINFNDIFESNVVSDAAYAGSVEVGGQYIAAWLAGLLSSQNPVFSGTGYPSIGSTVWDGDPYIFSVTELDEAMGDGWIITRFLNNSYVIGKGVTHTTDLSWNLLPHREVTNYIHKNLARTVGQFIGKQLTGQTLSAITSISNKFLSTAISAGFISSGVAVARSHATEVDAVVLEVEFVTIKPVNKIYINFQVS